MTDSAGKILACSGIDAKTHRHHLLDGAAGSLRTNEASGASGAGPSLGSDAQLAGIRASASQDAVNAGSCLRNFRLKAGSHKPDGCARRLAQTNSSSSTCFWRYGQWLKVFADWISKTVHACGPVLPGAKFNHLGQKTAYGGQRQQQLQHADAVRINDAES